MPTALAVTLVVAMLAALTLRWAVSRRGRAAVRTPAADTAVGVIGGLGLVAHCTAMFYGETLLSLLGGVPGVLGYADAVNNLGGVSIVAYAVPAVLVLDAARRRGTHAVPLLVGAVVVVGVTMYDGGPLWVHLAAISLLVAVLAWLVSPLSRRPLRAF